MDDDLTERMCIGTWTVREEMEKNPAIAGEFDMRMLAVREVSLSPRQFDPRGGEPSITFKARLEALPAMSRLTSSPWIPASPQWRIAALKEHNEGAFLCTGHGGAAPLSSITGAAGLTAHGAHPNRAATAC